MSFYRTYHRKLFTASDVLRVKTTVFYYEIEPVYGTKKIDFPIDNIIMIFYK
jgi:hypothetical protein